MSYLHAQVNDWKVLRERLKAQFPDLEDADLVDTLDGQFDVREACARMLRAAEDDAMMVDGIAARQEQLAARKARLNARIERLRAAVLTAMQETGIRKIEEPEFTASIARRPAAVVITDEDSVPDDYATTVRKIDKKALRDALKAGAAVPGAALSNGSETLTLRRA